MQSVGWQKAGQEPILNGESMGLIVNKKYVDVPLEQLVEHPDNPRVGDVEVIAEMIKSQGFWGHLIVHESTMQVLAGNHRLKALRELGKSTAPCCLVDCDADTAKRILLADNRTQDLADYDIDKVFELLSTVGVEDTGYTEDEFTFMQDAYQRSDQEADSVAARVEATAAKRRTNFKIGPFKWPITESDLQKLTTVGQSMSGGAGDDNAVVRAIAVKIGLKV